MNGRSTFIMLTVLTGVLACERPVAPAVERPAMMVQAPMTPSTQSVFRFVGSTKIYTLKDVNDYLQFLGGGYFTISTNAGGTDTHVAPGFVTDTVTDHRYDPVTTRIIFEDISTSLVNENDFIQLDHFDAITGRPIWMVAGNHGNIMWDDNSFTNDTGSVRHELYVLVAPRSSTLAIVRVNAYTYQITATWVNSGEPGVSTEVHFTGPQTTAPASGTLPLRATKGPGVTTATWTAILTAGGKYWMEVRHVMDGAPSSPYAPMKSAIAPFGF